MKRCLALLAFAAAAACTTMPASAPSRTPEATEPLVMPPQQADACKAASYAGLVGKPATDPRVPSPQRLVRHIRPDSIVTMEYVFARLNIEIDASGIVTGVRCG